MIKIIAKRYVLPHRLPEYVDMIKQLVDETRQEQGCEEYDLYIIEAEDLAIMHETWATEADFEAHSERLISSGWQGRLNTYSDPERPGKVTLIKKVY